MPNLGAPEQPDGQRVPNLALHVGQAPRPCRARVTSAIAICSSRVARSARGAYRRPPLRSQVPWSNCTPPKKPLPLLIAQLPPASQAASASQVAPLLTAGTSVPGLAPTRSTASRAGASTSLATGSRPVSAPLTDATANVTYCVPGVPGSSTT